LITVSSARSLLQRRLECVAVHVIGRREGRHAGGDRIRSLLEKHRQILVPHLP
jgi:hypothetical protein